MTKLHQKDIFRNLYIFKNTLKNNVCKYLLKNFQAGYVTPYDCEWTQSDLKNTLKNKMLIKCE